MARVHVITSIELAEDGEEEEVERDEELLDGREVPVGKQQEAAGLSTIRAADGEDHNVR
jgi:hypothetical protein